MYCLVFAFLVVCCSTLPLSKPSVSGISSGAYLATQYQVAYSSSVAGAGIIAGGPYYCAIDSIGEALSACMSVPELIILTILEGYTKEFASSGSIDALSNLQSHSVFIFSGQNDRTVYPGVVQKLQQMYSDLGLSNITTNYNTQAGHSFPTTGYGNPCGTTMSPYITNCNFDGAGAILQTIYGTLKQPTTPISANLKKMSLSKFVPNGGSPGSLSLDDTFYYYQPSSCHGNCTVHVAFHGCLMSYSDIQLDFVTGAGYNGWAEANDIVM
eukprot:TRINITY_DN5285_c0_g1_i5.p1 TRINITY_DN5285_c0_g1~~TRINITY_DN5285_c0_g1_i5.p1  ORF type:complete len:310 (+),score=53.36 TRINITY_DN5285_c0_g1_i5:125-931(+)